MFSLNSSKKCKQIKENKEKNEIIFLRRISKLFSLFLLLMIMSEIFRNKNKMIFDKNKYPIFFDINNSTLKIQYFTRFCNIFDTYRNETELSDEYKNKFKQYLLKEYSSLFKKSYKKIDAIIFNKRMNFGNAIFIINNLIYFCEILGCKKIYLYKDYWFVKKPIYDKELDITISPLTITNWDNQTSVYYGPKTSFSDNNYYKGCFSGLLCKDFFSLFIRHIDRVKYIIKNGYSCIVNKAYSQKKLLEILFQKIVTLP